MKCSKKFELKCIFLSGLCIIMGCVLDWNILAKNNILIRVDDIETFALSVLQIQTTIATLTIAIIAMIAGSTADSHMGVSVSDFYLNIKPCWLTQKKLVLISFFLCLMGVMVYPLQLYNLIFAFFIVTMIMVGLSVEEIYSVFRGRTEQNQEIEMYINKAIESTITCKRKVEIFRKFVLDWERVIDSQDKMTYEKYRVFFAKCVKEILESSKTDIGAIGSIQQECHSMAYRLLGSEKGISKQRGIGFIQFVYEIILGYIYVLGTQEIKDEAKRGIDFSFFSGISYELQRNMGELNVENIEKEISLDFLIDSVHKVAICFQCTNEIEDNGKSDGGYLNDNNEYVREISQLNLFIQHIGGYLAKQKRKGDNINKKYWARVLKYGSEFSEYNIPEEKVNIFLQSKLTTYFDYCYGLLVADQEDIVKEGVYFTGESQLHRLNNKYQMLFYVSVHCYIYYLAEREWGNCISKDIRESAKKMWDDNRVQADFYSILESLAHNKEWLEPSVVKEIYQIVRSHECFPQNGSAKEMVLEYVVLEFYLFIILFIECEFGVLNLLESAIDDQIFCRYVLDNQMDRTKEILESLYVKVRVCGEKNEQSRETIEIMYDNFERVIRKKQKIRFIEAAEDNQNAYSKDVDEEKLCKIIKECVIKRIQERFAIILDDKVEQKEVLEVPLLCIDEYTINFLDYNILSGYYDYIDACFLSAIEKYLRENNAVKIKSRFEDYKGDKEFMDYLTVNNLRILLGKKYILSNRDPRNRNKYKKFIEDYDTVYTAHIQEGMALRKNAVHILLQDIIVSIRPLEIKDSQVEYDEENKMYKYAVTEGVSIDFNESELKDYLNNNEKRINIIARLFIQLNEEDCGTIFED